MGNNADQMTIILKAHQGLDCHIQRLWIKAAKALIHKHGLDADAACMVLDNLRQSQRKRQRSLEAFTA